MNKVYVVEVDGYPQASFLLKSKAIEYANDYRQFAPSDQFKIATVAYVPIEV